MSRTVVIRKIWAGQLGEADVNAAVTLYVDVVDTFTFTVPVGHVDYRVDLAFELALVEAYMITCSKDARLQTNNTDLTASGSTIDVDADVAVMWDSSCGLPKHFDDNVTRLYITDLTPTDGEDMEVEIRVARNNGS